LELYRSIIDALNCGAAITNKIGNVLFCNALFEDYIGIPNGRLIHHINQSINELDITSMYERVATSNKSTKILKTIFKESRFIAEYELSLSSIKNTELLVFSIIDRTETAIAHNEFNFLFENTGAFIAIIDSHQVVLRSNEKFRFVFGENTHSKKIYELYRKRKTDIPNIPSSLALRDGKTHTLSQMCYSKNEERIHLISTAIPLDIENGKPQKIIEISTDITELIRTQEQLTFVNDFYNDVIKRCVEGIIIVNNQNKVKLINDIAKEIIGWNKERKPGFALIRNILPKHIFELENIVSEQLTISTESGIKKEVIVSSHALSGNNGRLIVISDYRESSIQSSLRLESSNVLLDRVNDIVYAYINFTRDKKTVACGLYDTKLEQLNDPELVKYWRNTKKSIGLYDEILSTFIHRMLHISKKRTYIKPSTIFDRLHQKIIAAIDVSPVEIKYNSEYQNNILVNPDVVVDALYILVVASILDVLKAKDIIGTIRISIVYNNDRQPTIVIEDNYVDTAFEIRPEEDYAYNFSFADILIRLMKTNIEFIGKPYLGRKLSIKIP